VTGETTLSRVPPHLRHLVVQQDYERYTAVDHAVWRFVLLQTHDRLKATAHPAYVDGLTRTGISVERIPRVTEMDEHLAPFGWGAVCVDGFIPPRAFQELQSLSILPIAADVRTAEHLVYTPAPDIIHEAAGHAPILPEPVYATYLRRIGAAGARAFTLPEDGAVDRAIHALSEVKEQKGATAEQLAEAEGTLAAARAGVKRTSEAARLSRLYWWTAEYGLFGTPKSYKLYGAGLLSSLWESFSCHEARVEKLPLSEQASELDYDVTRPQPQLFVTPSFEALHDVLDRVVRALPSVRGGEAALAEAELSGEIATITLGGDARLYGALTLRVVDRGTSALLVLADGGRVELDGRRFDASWLGAVLGDSRRSLVGLEPGPIELELPRGARLSGVLRQALVAQDGATAVLVMAGGRLAAEGALERPLAAGDVVVLAEHAAAAHAGAPAHYFPSTAAPLTLVPKARVAAPAEAELLGLYEAALTALRSSLGAEVVPVFERVHRGLRERFPHDWLLRWNLLESLQKLTLDVPLAEALRGELAQLETHYHYREPIASGLRYLSRAVLKSESA
jgi:phenylalanine-4-hydroxylase